MVVDAIGASWLLIAKCQKVLQALEHAKCRKGARVARPEFTAIAQSALASSGILVPRWLPEGRRMGTEWLARNPTRPDQHLGSFKINLKSGRWADFATGDAGGDLISLRAYLDGTSQRNAALRLVRELGL